MFFCEVILMVGLVGVGVFLMVVKFRLVGVGEVVMRVVVFRRM